MKTFKKITPIAALVAAMFAVAPQQAEARGKGHHHSHTYASGRTSCGCAIYTKRVVKGHDRHGRPVYAYYRQPVKHHCNSVHYRSVPRTYSSCGTHRTASRSTYHHNYRGSSRSGISVTYRSGW
ncbi:hypothetical protein ACFPK9_09195 [Rubritalea spongiae]|uniref:Uncharacterized protein n=1 Tax=Rubritalea spongiae TaxID=430797 RepID=A0ABW5E6S6_9BACT